ncbi:MAG: DegT/DnrJ/EryC1/StrS family aminotransferase [Leeuwenhoekiella sp.]
MTSPTAENKIHVTKPVLPDKEEYLKYINKIWDNCWLTNNGPLVRELEHKLQEYLDVDHVQYVTNGTIALQLAIKDLELEGEIITTPYSYVASTSSILWQNCKPVFADLKKNTFAIDPEKIKKQINSKTCAILATHVYGIPCDVSAIEELAKEYNLKVIYDAAHAFGVKLNGKSIFNYGDVSATSFHATKVFNTIEGGAIVTNSAALKEKVSLSRAFGHRADDHYRLGINGKNSEFHAAAGLCNLKVIDQIIDKRKTKFDRYKEQLSGLELKSLYLAPNLKYNYGYFPVVLPNHQRMLRVKEALEAQNIYPRRYFYPSLNNLPYIDADACPISEKLSQTVLCLPFYHDLEDEIIDTIAAIIKETLSDG